MIAAYIIGGLILLAMVCVSSYGWVTLPADARVPIHFGISYNNFVPKRLGLVVHPAAGLLVYLIFVVTIGSRHATNGSKAPVPVEILLPLIMCVLLVVQIGAIKVARSRSGSLSA